MCRGGSAPTEEVDRLGNDLAAVALHPLLIVPFRVVDAAANQNLHARSAMGLNRLAKAVECGDAVPFGVLEATALVVAKRLAVRVARTRGREAKAGDEIGSAPV